MVPTCHQLKLKEPHGGRRRYWAAAAQEEGGWVQVTAVQYRGMVRRLLPVIWVASTAGRR